MRRLISRLSIPVIALSLVSIIGVRAQSLPTPEPAESAQPEYIGGVHALPAKCVALRDVVIPAYASMRKADAQFKDVALTLPKYAQSLDDLTDPLAPQRNRGTQSDMLLAAMNRNLTQMGTTVSQMTEKIHKIELALADPKLSPKDPDPAIQQERAQLIRLLDIQGARLALLNEFIATEQAREAKLEVGALQTNSGLSTGAPDAQPTDDRLPKLTGSSITDKSTLQDWTAGMELLIRATEDQVAKALVGVSDGCKPTK